MGLTWAWPGVDDLGGRCRRVALAGARRFETVNHDRGDEGASWGWLGGLLAIPLMLLCCGGPLLLALAASLGIGSWLAAHGMLLAGAVVLAAVVVGVSVWVIRHGRQAAAECCPPTAPVALEREEVMASPDARPSARPERGRS
jgi:hypothetical protein